MILFILDAPLAANKVNPTLLHLFREKGPSFGSERKADGPSAEGIGLLHKETVGPKLKKA